MNVLEVKDMSVVFGSEGKTLPAVTDITFTLERGEILALVGESGCGKSVTCMTLAKLVAMPPAKIEKGNVLFTDKNGRTVDVLKLTGSELRKVRGGGIAYIFQEPAASLNPVFRVGKQIEEAILLHRPEITDPAEEVVRLLKQVGIPGAEQRAKCYPHELSGGMQQRVMIAMALASSPEILIADEPTTALDVTIQAQILELLASLRKEKGMSIILVTHNLGIVSEMADRVCVMYAGRIVETAPVREVIDHPEHPYTTALLKAVPVLGREGGRLETIPGAVPPPARFAAGCRFYERCSKYAGLPEAEKERCRSCVPEMREGKPGHFCACHQAWGSK